MRLVALDFETTGSVPGWPNAPWQLGAVEIDPENGVRPETAKEWFFNIPRARAFSARAPGRWAQLREMLETAPSFPETWPHIHAFTANACLVAHNAATERTLFEREAPLARMGPWVDTLRLVRRYWPLLKSHALGDVIDVFGLKAQVDALCPGRTWHDALYDACAGAVLFAHIARVLEMDPAEMLEGSRQM